MPTEREIEEAAQRFEAWADQLDPETADVEYPLNAPATQPSGEPFRNVFARRTIPHRIRYLAGKLRESDQNRDAVMLALEALADEMEAS